MIKHNYKYIRELESTLSVKLLPGSEFVFELVEYPKLSSSSSYFYVLAINRL